MEPIDWRKDQTGQGKQGQREGQNPGRQRDMKEAVEGEFKCRECEETFDSQEELEEHEANCAPE